MFLKILHMKTMMFVDAYGLVLNLNDHDLTNTMPTECIVPKLSGEALGKFVIKLTKVLDPDKNNSVGIRTDSFCLQRPSELYIVSKKLQ